MKAVFKFFGTIFKIFNKGFYYLCGILAKGFFYYPKKFFEFMSKIFKNSKRLPKVVKHFEKRQLQPEICLLLILYFLAGCTLYRILYVKPVDVVHHNFDDIKNLPSNNDGTVSDNTDNTGNNSSNNNQTDTTTHLGVWEDNNPYRKFAKTPLDQVNIASLKRQNKDVVAWLSVDGTTINYPIVQTTDNSYYLEHSFWNYKTYNGWTFMDYRNDPEMNDDNTIFYGHNLLNKTAFGSLADVFTTNWANTSNKSIVVITETKKYYYLIFSAYYTTPEVYYLQNTFYSRDEYKNFLETISSRNILNIDNSVSVNDKIITLSTCNDGSAGRKVVHAKLVAVY